MCHAVFAGNPRSSSTLPADRTVLLRGALMSIPDLSFCCNLALNFPLSTSCRTSGEAFAERLPGAANGLMQQHRDDDFRTSRLVACTWAGVMSQWSVIGAGNCLHAEAITLHESRLRGAADENIPARRGGNPNAAAAPIKSVVMHFGKQRCKKLHRAITC